MKKKYEIDLRCWQNGSGWSYEEGIGMAEIEDGKVQEYVHECAYDYFADGLNRDAFADNDYVIVAIAPDGEETESEWLSSFLDEDDED